MRWMFDIVQVGPPGPLSVTSNLFMIIHSVSIVINDEFNMGDLFHVYIYHNKVCFIAGLPSCGLVVTEHCVAPQLGAPSVKSY